MVLIAKVIALASGFALMRLPMAPRELMATSLAIDAALAPLTMVIAARRGRSMLRWAIPGLAFGAWALAYVLIVAPRPTAMPARPEGPGPSSTSDAA